MNANPSDLYFIAIGGTGMAPLACLLRQAGHRVRGSDQPIYPPMSDLLAEHGIEPLVGFDPRHLEPAPDLVVVGNAVPRHNVEALETERLGLPRISMPQALHRFFLEGRRPLVVSGTHGKTTTTSLAAWVYTACGGDPGYLIGGVPANLPASFRIGGGERFVIEGDEYNAAYFDRGPKFLHYAAETAILTSVEYDHADLYPDEESILAAYRSLARALPADGLLVACGDSTEVRQVAASASCRVLFYGLSAENDIRPGEIAWNEDTTRVRVTGVLGDQALSVPLPGRHGVLNSLAVWAVARADQLPAVDVAAAIAGFAGVKRRLEELGRPNDVLLLDDFAHHPTAVRETLAGLAQRYPDRRRVVVFEPRSLTAGRSMFFDAYLEAFAGADRALLAPIFHRERLAGDGFDREALVAELRSSGTEATAHDSVDALLSCLLETVRPGDLVVTMSSGSFEGLPHRLLAALTETAEVAAPAQRV